MPKTAFPPVAELLHRHKRLEPLLTRIHLHQRLLRMIRKQLPDPMGNHCLACVLKEESRLILYTDTAAWASQLRFHEAKVLPALCEIAPVRRLRVRVFLPIRKVQKTPLPPRVPSPGILTQMEQSAASVEEPEIHHALRLLVNSLRRAGAGS